MSYSDITPVNYDLFNNTIGDDWRIPIPVYLSDRETVFPFTGWEGFANVESRSKDGTNVISFSTYDGTMDLQDGKIYLIADKDQTEQLSAGEYVWSCKFLEPVFGDLRTLILRSRFEIVNRNG